MPSKNYVQKGSHVTVSPGATVVSGDFVRASGFTGIILNNGLSGVSNTMALDGVWALTWSVQGTLTQGTNIYWDTSASALSIGKASGDFLVGRVLIAPDANNKFHMLLLPQSAPDTVEQI